MKGGSRHGERGWRKEEGVREQVVREQVVREELACMCGIPNMYTRNVFSFHVAYNFSLNSV